MVRPAWCVLSRYCRGQAESMAFCLSCWGESVDTCTIVLQLGLFVLLPRVCAPLSLMNSIVPRGFLL